MMDMQRISQLWNDIRVRKKRIDQLVRAVEHVNTDRIEVRLAVGDEVEFPLAAGLADVKDFLFIAAKAHKDAMHKSRLELIDALSVTNDSELPINTPYPQDTE